VVAVGKSIAVRAWPNKTAGWLTFWPFARVVVDWRLSVWPIDLAGRALWHPTSFSALSHKKTG